MVFSGVKSFVFSIDILKKRIFCNQLSTVLCTSKYRNYDKNYVHSFEVILRLKLWILLS